MPQTQADTVKARARADLTDLAVKGRAPPLLRRCALHDVVTSLQLHSFLSDSILGDHRH